MLQYNNNSLDRQISDKKNQVKVTPHIPKLVQIQFAQFLNNLLEYASELTYFSINAFQTSSLRRVQINTLVKIRTIDGNRLIPFPFHFLFSYVITIIACHVLVHSTIISIVNLIISFKKCVFFVQQVLK